MEYTWDHRNRLTKVTFKNNAGTVTKTVDYAYDAFNQWIARTVDVDGAQGSTPHQRTAFVYDDGQVVLQFDKEGSGAVAAGDLTHRYLWGPAVDMLLADEQVDWTDNGYGDGDVLWALTDHLGSVGHVVDSAGQERLRRQFDGYGNVVAETHYNAVGGVVTTGAGFVDVAFGYTGKFFDDWTGLQQNWHRWYDAAVGRWISQDPIGFAGGDANLSRYVGNQPTSFTDSTGLTSGADFIQIFLRRIRFTYLTDLFFGRDYLIEEVISRINCNTFVWRILRRVIDSRVVVEDVR